MNTLKKWAGVLGLLVGFCMVGNALTIWQMRGTGTNRNTNEATLDDSGNLTLNGNLTTSGSGTNSIAGAVTHTGAVTNSANVTNSALTNFPPTNYIIGVGTVTTVTSTYETIVSTGGNLTVTATPSISTATVVGGTTAFPDGTLLVLSSTSTQTMTYQDNGTLSGSKLYLGAATRAVGNHKVLTLIYNATLTSWTEQSYANNN